ncbi:MAG: TrkH family potassium uptake protein [Oscillibacter sp.]|nr:TrkH family potassium uptake protein [Oscillibacter sp.]
MNNRMIAYVIGRSLLAEALLLLVPLLAAALYGEALSPYLIPMALLLALGALMTVRKPKNTSFYARDGLAIAALVWIFMSAFGALPFVLSGDIPHYIDAFFETVSGFTTTGATILTAVEPLTRAGLLWRSFTHWVGGMGVLVFVMALLPMSDGHGMHMLRAEMPGPTASKLVSRMSDTAKILYVIYFVMTVILIVLLLLGGMPLFDTLIHAFGTAGTGGFSCRNISVGAYDNLYFEIVIGVFMLLFGINFNLYYFLLIRRFRDVFRSEEMWAYVGIVTASTLAIAVNISQMYGGFATGLRHAFFQVSTIITTTGYASTDFNTWPAFSKTILVLLMFIGGCAGSTAGGMKVARVVMWTKSSYHDMRKMIHPNAVTTVRFEGKPLGEKNVHGVYLYMTVYMLVFAVSCLLLSLDGMDLVTTFTSVTTCFNNVGPGLEVVGPMGNFSSYSAWAKALLSFDMLAGRLELFPMLLLFAPSIWKKRKVSAGRV